MRFDARIVAPAFKLLIVHDVIVFVVIGRRKHKYERICGKVSHRAPQSVGHIQSVKGPVQRNRLFVFTIVQYHVEAARQRHDKLLALLVGMTAAVAAAGHIVYPIHPFYGKRYMVHLFDERQIASRIFNLGQSQQFRIVNTVHTSFLKSRKPHVGARLITVMQTLCLQNRTSKIRQTRNVTKLPGEETF